MFNQKLILMEISSLEKKGFEKEDIAHALYLFHSDGKMSFEELLEIYDFYKLFSFPRYMTNNQKVDFLYEHFESILANDDVAFLDMKFSDLEHGIEEDDQTIRTWCEKTKYKDIINEDKRG